MVVRKKMTYRVRRIIAVILALGGVAGVVITNPASYEATYSETVDSLGYDASLASSDSNTEANESSDEDTRPLAVDILEKLAVKGRAPKTGYSREEFYKTWPEVEGCSLRQRILKREFGDSAKLADDKCTVLAGELDEIYTGQHLVFTERAQISKGLQIDHVVALSDAWQKGAQQLSKEERFSLATDPLNLLAVDSSANQQKSDGDAATWLPKNKGFRCQYVARQVSVKYKYQLWVTEAEKTAISQVLEKCPSERAIGIE